MEIREVLKALREKHGLTQEQMAERAMVTRQAVSRWENGETQPNTDTLKILSREFGVSINTLLGSPRTLFCQCCGMPLSDDDMISREKDGSLNEDYCKWCYSDGAFAYPSKDSLIDFLVAHMPNPDQTPEDERRAMFDSLLSQLKHWKQQN
ncbi:MAG: helix-turn-helix domain-containing protein [Clostridia bacterium]|nr:helix-turn-helix domain-containing protein [Clostridia bacterium]